MEYEVKRGTRVIVEYGDQLAFKDCQVCLVLQGPQEYREHLQQRAVTLPEIWE